MKEGWKKTEIGLIPDNWSIVLFPKFVLLQRGKDLTKTSFKEGKIPVAGSSGTMGFHNESFVKAPGVTVGRSGSCGRIFYYNIDFWAHNTSLYVKDFNNNDRLFSYFYLRYLDVGKYKTGVSVPTLDRNALNNILVPLPPLSEQFKIAYVLSTVQKAIEQQDKLILNSTELKKNLMQKLFTQGTKGEKQKQTKIDLIPESWEVKPLIDTVEFIDYGVSQAIPKTPPKKGVKIVSTADINRAGQLLYDKVRTIEVPQRTVEKLLLKDGDLLFNWRNSAELIGKSTIFHEQSEPHIFASFVLRINCGEKKSHNYFLKYLMNHYREEGVFIKLSRRAVNQANYNRNEISVLPIPVPPYKEQVEIAITIGKFEMKLEHHKKKKQTLTALFKTLLHELMTGQRRVHELEFEGLPKVYTINDEPLSMVAED
jgi:type I restriction enzyme S subunit